MGGTIHTIDSWTCGEIMRSMNVRTFHVIQWGFYIVLVSNDVLLQPFASPSSSLVVEKVKKSGNTLKIEFVDFKQCNVKNLLNNFCMAWHVTIALYRKHFDKWPHIDLSSRGHALSIWTNEHAPYLCWTVERGDYTSIWCCLLTLLPSPPRHLSSYPSSFCFTLRHTRMVFSLHLHSILFILSSVHTVLRNFLSLV